MVALQIYLMSQNILEQKVVDARGIYNTERSEATVSGEDAFFAAESLNSATTDLKDAELSAYINTLPGSQKLTALLESNPDEVRAVIEGMKDVNPGDLGNALAYFG